MPNMSWGTDNPSVGLLNIGEEETKGTPTVKAAFELMKEHPEINFAGNIEGNALFRETMTDVVSYVMALSEILFLRWEKHFIIYIRSRNLKDCIF